MFVPIVGRYFDEWLGVNLVRPVVDLVAADWAGEC